jgi:RNA polymerase sigma-70 factor, ECF subfamily
MAVRRVPRCFCPRPAAFVVAPLASNSESNGSPTAVVRDADEQWLVEQARRGDLEAFNSLVERHQVAVYNLCLRMLGDRAAAEDATQEAFLSAYRAMEQLKGPYLGAWLLRIGANVCYDELRRRKRRPSHSLDELLDDPERPMALPTKGGGPEDESLRSELRRSIEQALLALPPDQRLAVVLCDVEGLSYDEIAEVTRASLGTVKSRISRGRARMRQLLRETREPFPPPRRRDE